jgi:hypothetical protein
MLCLISFTVLLFHFICGSGKNDVVMVALQMATTMAGLLALGTSKQMNGGAASNHIAQQAGHAEAC